MILYLVTTMEWEVLIFVWFGSLSTLSGLQGSPSLDANYVMVEINNGALRGYRTIRNGNHIDTFYGIPYAEPPIGVLRFKPPERPSNWTGVRDATEPSPRCIQIPYEKNNRPQSEDCLYLNVHTPTNSSNDLALPVMVWIHGGGYRAGEGALRNGEILATKDVLVVTFNYRLDALGFMSTEDNVMPGNYGMLDQVAALQWVKENIDAFGGDPKQVTIFGESAGSTSVSLLLLSPLTKGLFHRAIMESGVSLVPWGYAHPARAISHRILTKIVGFAVGCTSLDSSELLRCFQNVDAEELVKTTRLVGSLTNEGRILSNPRVEQTYGFLPDLPLRLWAKGNFHHVNTFRGFNQHEYAVYINLNELERVASAATFREEAESLLRQFAIVDIDKIVRELEDYHLKHGNRL